MLELSIILIGAPLLSAATEAKPAAPPIELTPQQKSAKVAQFFETYARRHEKPAAELIKKLNAEIAESQKLLATTSVKSKQYTTLQEKLAQAKIDLRASELVLEWGELTRAYTKAAYAQDNASIGPLGDKLALVGKEYRELTKKPIFNAQAEADLDKAEAASKKRAAATR